MIHMRVAGLIPARSGSERVKDKNIYELSGKPLLGIAALKARDVPEIDDIFPITDSRNYMDKFVEYGISPFPLRPTTTAQSHSPDIEWINWWLSEVGESTYDVLVILRPTSPLRSRSTISAGINKLVDVWQRADSVRCVSSVTQHPGKMWLESDGVINPLLPFSLDSTPWHSNQTKVLPRVLVQNAMLEVIKISSIIRSRTISGGVVVPLVREGYEALDVNDPLDLTFLEFLLNQKPDLIDW